MMDNKLNINISTLNAIIKFQRRYRFLVNETKDLESRVSKVTEILISMLNNLELLNNLKIIDDKLFILILNELKEIKKKINKIPKKITIKKLTSDISIQILVISEKINKALNHISCISLVQNLKFLYNDNEKFNTDERKNINFYNSFFHPISIWESELHKKKIEYKSSDNNLNSKNILNELIETKMNSSIIIGESSLPAFLKTLTDFALKDNSQEDDRKNNFNLMDVLNVLNHDKIVLKKNPDAKTLFEEKNGALLYLKINNNLLVIQGYFKDDLLNLSSNHKIIQDKINGFKNLLLYNFLEIDTTFKMNYLNSLNLRDIILVTKKDLEKEIEKKYGEYLILKHKELNLLINEFLLASKYRKIEILTLLLIGDENEKKIGFLLFDILKCKDKKNISKQIFDSLHFTLKEFLKTGENLMTTDEEELEKLNTSDLSYEKRINLFLPNNDIKTKAMEKLKSIKTNFQGDNKAQSWLDGLLKIPFNIYKENDIMNFKNIFMKKLKLKNNPSDNIINTKLDELNDDNLRIEWEQYNIDKKEYLLNMKEKLNNAVYGHDEAKLQLERLLAQWINGKTKGAILGLHGPPGTGKTSLAKNGLSKCLIDTGGKPRPFAFLPLGGSVNGSTLVGHNFTYVGSTWGRVVDILITSKCMNPIIYIDELDKVSQTEHGREIISILTHLTDLTQNDEFEDKYFSGIQLDLSKALIVFSFNDISKIDPILKDRITIIETKPLTLPEKLKILKDYTIPEILNEVGFAKEDIIVDDKLLEFIINTYTNEAGVRKIKEKIIDIIRDINLNNFYDNDFVVPFTITKEYIERLFEDKPKMKPKKIAKESNIGLVNGLYATTTGVGGLTLIQVMKYPSEKMLDLTLTGKQGDVMKESVNYALKIAYSLLSDEEKEKILEDSNNNKKFGLHVHTPEAATPKDGPSAGAAMTLAIYSVLTGKKVKNTVALTGEIDLCKNVTAIGGVHAKLLGAKTAGVKLALIPKENEDDFEKLKRQKLNPEDENFTVKYIENISDVLNFCIEN
jgi:ATP-dependent Lon protease